MAPIVSEEKAKKLLEGNYREAEKILEDKDKLEIFLQRLEQKLETLPIIGDTLAMVPIFISMVRSFSKGEYTDIPLGILIALISALIYWLSPLDIIPDGIPGIGYLDDAAVVTACAAMSAKEIAEYKAWREENGKVLI